MRHLTMPVILIAGLISGTNVEAASQVVYVQAPNAVHLPDTGGMYPLAVISSATRNAPPSTLSVDSALYAVMEANDPTGDLVIGAAFPTSGDVEEGGAVAVVPVDVSFQSDWYRVELSDSVNAAGFVAIINENFKGVAYAEPQYQVHLDGDLEPNDPLYGRQGYLTWHGLPRTWGMGITGSSQVAVGVLDGDIDRSHPDFAGVEFFGTAGSGSDYHGSAVASVIRAATNNNYLMAGINWGARLGVYRIHTDDQSGIATKLRAAASAGCQIINCSWYVENGSGGSVNSALVEQAIAAVTQAGAIVIAAAGNDGPNPLYPHYPAGYTKKALAIGGLNRFGL
jgi:subtilisin family serine protease